MWNELHFIIIATYLQLKCIFQFHPKIFSGPNHSSGSESTDETYNKMQGYPTFVLEAGAFTGDWM